MNHFKHHEVEEDGESNWLVSYADLMTLLWGFFVIISSLSTPDSSKVEKIKEETSKAMGGTYTHPYNKLTDELKKVIQSLEVEKVVQVEKLVDGVQITLQSTYFFKSAEASILPEAKVLLDQIAKALVPHSKDNLIFIEGHTDDLPIQNIKFKNNWELSTKRATEVLALFLEQGAFEKNLRPVGLSDTSPLENFRSPAEESRAKNRRVVIRLQKIISVNNQSSVKK